MKMCLLLNLRVWGFLTEIIYELNTFVPNCILQCYCDTFLDFRFFDNKI